MAEAPDAIAAVRATSIETSASSALKIRWLVSWVFRGPSRDAESKRRTMRLSVRLGGVPAAARHHRSPASGMVTARLRRVLAAVSLRRARPALSKRD
jgi:hypothetical protein